MADFGYVPGSGYAKRPPQKPSPKRFTKEWWFEQGPGDWHPRWKRWRNNIVTALAMGLVFYVLAYTFYTDLKKTQAKNELLERCATIHAKKCEFRSVVVPVGAPASKAVFLKD